MSWIFSVDLYVKIHENGANKKCGPTKRSMRNRRKIKFAHSFERILSVLCQDVPKLFVARGSHRILATEKRERKKKTENHCKNGRHSKIVKVR